MQPDVHPLSLSSLQSCLGSLVHHLWCMIKMHPHTTPPLIYDSTRHVSKFSTVLNHTGLAARYAALPDPRQFLYLWRLTHQEAQANMYHTIQSRRSTPIRHTTRIVCIGYLCTLHNHTVHTSQTHPMHTVGISHTTATAFYRCCRQH